MNLNKILIKGVLTGIFAISVSFTALNPILAGDADVATKPVAHVQNVIVAKPLQIVQNPAKFLNQKVKMTATFDKFSTLGLDYNRALRPSTDYIGFLIQRDDVVNHNIPLSEMKLFLKREYAENFIDLNTGDEIEITGNVFSNALGDAWIDVQKIAVTKKSKEAAAKQ